MCLNSYPAQFEQQTTKDRQTHKNDLLELSLERKDGLDGDLDGGDDRLVNAELAELRGELVVEERAGDGDPDDSTDELKECYECSALRHKVRVLMKLCLDGNDLGS
jgi:hypothetical protein